MVKGQPSFNIYSTGWKRVSPNQVYRKECTQEKEGGRMPLMEFKTERAAHPGTL